MNILIELLSSETAFLPKVMSYITQRYNSLLREKDRFHYSTIQSRCSLFIVPDLLYNKCFVLWVPLYC